MPDLAVPDEADRPAPLKRAVRRSGQALCWIHASAMALTAVEALAHPSSAWWSYLWPTAWALAAAALVTWLALRAAEKCRTLPAADVGDPGEGDQDPDGDATESRSGYDHAA